MSYIFLSSVSPNTTDGKFYSDFQENVSNFTLIYEGKLQQLIKDARNPSKPNINENDLTGLVNTYKQSDYNYGHYLYDYLTERTREIHAIGIIYFETVKKDEPQIAAYRAAKIPFALITTKIVFIVTLKVLKISF